MYVCHEAYDSFDRVSTKIIRRSLPIVRATASYDGQHYRQKLKYTTTARLALAKKNLDRLDSINRRLQAL